MSSSIWTRCAGSSRVRRLELDAWRVVEAQHRISTRKLVDSVEEQRLLEELIESRKPPLPSGEASPSMHYLLTTPFRYPPLRYGSRFGTRSERGLWYGSEDLRTVFSEVAYYRLLFLEGTAATLEPLEVELSAFRAKVRTPRGIDLTRVPFREYRSRISSPARYDHSQSLGTDMRAAGVEAFRFDSARDAAGGVNVGVFTPKAFATRTPRDIETWHCIARRVDVELSRKDYLRQGVYRFARSQFERNGRLPAPAP